MRWGRILTLIITLGVAIASAQQTLTNDDVLKMSESKLGDGVILAKIKSSVCKFDTSTEALVKLKEAGVSDAVMQAMAEVTSAAPAAAPAVGAPANPNDPLTEHDPGIYLLQKTKDGDKLVGLEPTAYSQGKSGGVLASAMTYGVHKMKWKAVVRGKSAGIRVTEAKPTFYFYFERKVGTLSYSLPWMTWFGGLSSPNQFTLARFDRKSNERELIVGEFGTFGTSTGTRGKDVIELDLEKLQPGIYKVVPRTDIVPGEYCFFYTGQNQMMGMGGGSLFDFGVETAK